METVTVNYWHIPLFCDISFLGHDCPAACTIATSADASSTASKCLASESAIVSDSLGWRDSRARTRDWWPLVYSVLAPVGG